MTATHSSSGQARPTICLAMLVRDEAPVLSRCLVAVLPFIDNWCIFDTGSTDNSEAIIHQHLQGLPGELQARRFTDFSRLRNELYQLAGERADFVLMLDADEELLCLGETPLPAKPFDVGRLEIMQPGYSLRQARLLRSGLNLHFEGPVHEQLRIGPDLEQFDLQTVAIRHHRDGYRCRQTHTLANDIAHLEVMLAQAPDSTTELTLSRLLLAAGERDAARTRLEAMVESVDTAAKAPWFAAYLLGQIYKQDGETDRALERLLQAYETDPDRGEALYHLAELLGEQARWRDAYELTTLAIGLPTPTADYFEPDLYDWWIKLLHASFCVELERYQEAHSTLKTISPGRLNGEALAYRNELLSKPGMQRHWPADIKPKVQKSVPKLTIAMATYDDYDGVYFTIASILSTHPEVREEIEILVLDNNPTGICAQALRTLCASIDIARYIADEQIRGTAIRTQLFNYALGESVLCIDCHVLMLPGAIRQLIDYLDRHPGCSDLLQGPLISDNLNNARTHMKPDWHAGMYGRWPGDDQGISIPDKPFDIEIQGMGLFACRRLAWPGFNPRFVGFGGEEGYIHEKFRQRGDRTLCLPFLRWMHRFARPLGVPYQPRWEDWIRNYLIGFDELGLDTQALEAHYAGFIGFETMARTRAAYEREKQNPFFYFDAIYCINLDRESGRWQSVLRQAETLGFAHRLRRLPAIETPDNHHVGCALSHRQVLAIAQRQGFDNVLVLEDDVIFATATLANLADSLRELKGRDWDILYLGGHNWNQDYPLASGCRALREVGLVDADQAGPTTTHAIAYHHGCFERILNTLPDSPAEMMSFLQETLPGIDQLLAFDRKLRRYLAEPYVASQPGLLAQERTDFAPLDRG